MTGIITALAVWTAISIPAGLLIARCIPPTHDGHRRGVGDQGRAVVQSHGSVSK